MARETKPDADPAPRRDGAAPRGFGLIPALASALAVAAGCLVLAGWATDLEVLKRIVPGVNAMNPVTAACFVLLGVSLWLLRDEAPGPGTRRIARVLAWLVVAAGAIKLAQYAAGWEVGVDQVLFREKLGLGNRLPNRIGYVTAANFVMYGGALLLLDHRTRGGRWPAQYLALIAAGATCLPILGYAYGVPTFYGTLSYLAIALHSALTFVALSAGVMCARPERGIMRLLRSDNLGGVMARRLLPLAILFPAALGWLRLLGQRLGLYDTYLGLAIFATSMIFAFSIVVVWTASSLYRTDERRRIAESKYRSIFENAIEGIYQTTPGGAILTANPGMARILGYDSPEDLIRGVSDAGAQIWADRGEREKFVRIVREHGSVNDFETRARRKDGREIWMSLNAHAARWSDEGELVAIEGTLVDITERKRAEEEIRRQTELLGVLHEASLNLMNRLDLDNVLRDIAGGAAALLDAPGGYVSTVEPDGGGIVVRAAMGIVDDYVGIRLESGEGFNGRVWQTGEPSVLNLPYDTWEERSRNMKTTGVSAVVAVPIRSGEEVVGVIGVADDRGGRSFEDEDVAALQQFSGLAAVALDNARLHATAREELAERARTEKRLRDSEERMRMMVDGVSDYAIFMLDPDGNVASWNAGAERNKGYRGEEIIGEHFSRFYLPEDVERGHPWEELRIAASTGRYEEEGLRVRKDGSRFWANVLITALRDEAGNLRGFSKIVRDITERKLAQEELGRLNEDLVERNRDLAQKNEEIESFVYSVSHDLRSPLVNLEGFSRELELAAAEVRALLEDEAVPEDVRRRALELADEDILMSVRFIRSGVGRLSGIIDALLRLSRAGRVEYRWRAVDPNPVVERVLEAMGDTISNAGVEVEVAENMPPVRSDPTALGQIFDNLIGNAVKYRDPSRPGLVQVGCQKTGDGFNTFFVRDNGRGIPESALEKVFRIFQRVHPDVQGEGVGLALVQRLVQRHGGSLRVESTDGEGSTFFLELPAPEEGEDR